MEGRHHGSGVRAHAVLFVACRPSTPPPDPPLYRRTLKLETGEIGRQAGGAVLATDKDTVVYSTACVGQAAGDGSFAPFQVQYSERMSAAGRTASGFIKRDGRPRDPETLRARLIDRPLRPMLREGWGVDTQVLTWTMSYDPDAPPDGVSITASAAALYLSEVPLSRPVAGVRVGRVPAAEGDVGGPRVLVVNPTADQMRTSDLDLVIAGTERAVLMIEGFCDFFSDDEMLEAIAVGHASIGKLCRGVEEWANRAGSGKKADLPEGEGAAARRAARKALTSEVLKRLGDEIRACYSEIPGKAERSAALDTLRKRCLEEFAGDAAKALAASAARGLMSDGAAERAAAAVSGGDGAAEGSSEEDDASLGTANPATPVPPSAEDALVAFRRAEQRIMRRLASQEGIRSDGRGLGDVRRVTSRCGVLPRAHGTALFTRGETQAIATCTLGSDNDALKDGGLQDPPPGNPKRFYLQYFFPPSCVGETGRVGGPGRRELGHGALAERALAPAVPTQSEWPYTIRVESTITESNGSSSMASVCGGTLAMLDAGVPLSRPVAGVAMGLVLEDDGTDDPPFTVLTDILGSEDALGDMDFKVAGDADGVTAFQMDIKVEGVTLGVLREALKAAGAARRKILTDMLGGVELPGQRYPPVEGTRSEGSGPGPRGALAARAPRVERIVLPAGKVGAVIGQGGKVIKALQAATGCDLSVDSDASPPHCDVTAPDEDALALARGALLALVVEPEVGRVYRGAVISGLADFGCFVDILPGKAGLVHISEVAQGRVESCEAAGLAEGDVVDVLCLDVLDNGKLKLSLRAAAALDEETGDEGTERRWDPARDVDVPSLMAAAEAVNAAAAISGGGPPIPLGGWLGRNGYPGGLRAAELARTARTAVVAE